MTVRGDSEKGEDGVKARRKAAMAVLAQSSAVEIAEHLEGIEVPAYQNLREPEDGLVMLRGRIGGQQGVVRAVQRGGHRTARQQPRQPRTRSTGRSGAASTRWPGERF